MIRSSHSSAATHRRTRWVQRLGLLAIVVLIFLEPRIERWIAGQNENVDRQDGPVPDARPDSVTGDTASEHSRSPALEDDASDALSSIRLDLPSAPGSLKEIRKNVFQSSAGLIYGAESEDGHRLRHVMQHARDNPQKKIHGIFDGDGNRDFILAVIDEAWLKARTGGTDVLSDRQNDRQVYTINLRRRVGRMGGEEGKRRNYPECHFIRIVLENGNKVISAYPTRSF